MGEEKRGLHLPVSQKSHSTAVCVTDADSFRNLQTFHDLYNYSITRRVDFWADAWDDFGLIHEEKYTTVFHALYPTSAC